MSSDRCFTHRGASIKGAPPERPDMHDAQRTRARSIACDRAFVEASVEP